ncbi:MAG: hypothetical protein HYT39_03970 [Candidatus Sungbacteria bacterium]|nr:hypothetical protein [Candidatus Sungbacteria bacterium]
MDNKKLIPIIAVVVVILAGGIGFWYWQNKYAAPEEPAAAKVKDGLGAESFNKTKNPLANELPETNPFQANINPFK